MAKQYGVDSLKSPVRSGLANSIVVLLPLSPSLSQSPSRPAIAIIYFNYFFASVVSGCSYNLTASQIAHEMLLEYFVAMLAIMGLTTTFDKRSQRQLQPFGKYA